MTDPVAPSPEIAAVVGRWLHDDAARQEAATISLFSRSGARSCIGTDAGEVIGGDAMRDVFPAFTAAQARLFMEDVAAHGRQAGRVGRARAHCTVHRPGANTRSPMRSSAGPALEDGTSRIAHVRRSTPTSDIDAMGCDLDSLQALADAAVSRRLEIAETGIAAIMFADIVDGTPPAAAAGDAARNRILRDRVARVTREVEAAGGAPAKSLGGGTLSCFASARAAMQAATAIQRADAAPEAEPRLRVRIGLPTGDPVRAGDDVLGAVVDAAARIAAAASPEEIRVSEATRLRGGGGTDLACEDPIHAAPKGLGGEPLPLRLRRRETPGAP